MQRSEKYVPGEFEEKQGGQHGWNAKTGGQQGNGRHIIQGPLSHSGALGSYPVCDKSHGRVVSRGLM